jgi:hypothetical protein
MPTLSDDYPANQPVSAYMEEASAQDAMLDRKLANIRAQEAAGSITTRAAADARITAMEHHLTATRNLRLAYFPEE